MPPMPIRTIKIHIKIDSFHGLKATHPDNAKSTFIFNRKKNETTTQKKNRRES